MKDGSKKGYYSVDVDTGEVVAYTSDKGHRFEAEGKSLESPEGHTHGTSDKNGGTDTYFPNREHGEAENVNHSFTYRDKFLGELENLSFIELQYIEAMTTNEYVRQSARNLLRQTSFEESIQHIM